MKVEILLALLTIPVTGGILLARFYTRTRERRLVASRLARWSSALANVRTNRPLLRKSQGEDNKIVERLFGGLLENQALKSMLAQAGHESGLPKLIRLSALLFALPLIAALLLSLDPTLPFAGSVLLCLLPLAVLKIRAILQRNKFHDQLPDAIDLMVAVLRSGHSIPQAVQSVAQEIPAPCGKEFELILQRMNLGQPLSESMVISAARFESDDLDLIRRAIAIQLEVGGSLAELLDKTNGTLRQRLKLARQLRVLTAQSRLTATIVGLLPVVLAIGLNFLSPGYLQLLTNDQLGRLLVLAAIFLECMGLFLMHRMSTMRV